MSSSQPGGLIASVRSLAPAIDLAASRRFYRDIGFTERAISDDMIEMSLGPIVFLLQNYYVKDWAENCVFHVFVTDLDAWWAHVNALKLDDRHGVQAPIPPRQESWGLRQCYVFDPAGVLWQFAQAPASPLR